MGTLPPSRRESNTNQNGGLSWNNNNNALSPNHNIHHQSIQPTQTRLQASYYSSISNSGYDQYTLDPTNGANLQATGSMQITTGLPTGLNGFNNNNTGLVGLTGQPLQTITSIPSGAATIGTQC